MPFHICPDEIFALLMILPFIGVTFKKIHTWYYNAFLKEVKDEFKRKK